MGLIALTDCFLSEFTQILVVLYSFHVKNCIFLLRLKQLLGVVYIFNFDNFITVFVNFAVEKNVHTMSTIYDYCCDEGHGPASVSDRKPGRRGGPCRLSTKGSERTGRVKDGNSLMDVPSSSRQDARENLRFIRRGVVISETRSGDSPEDCGLEYDYKGEFPPLPEASREDSHMCTSEGILQE